MQSLLARGPATIEHQGLCRDMPCCSLRQKLRRFSNLVNANESFLWHWREHDLLNHLLFTELVFFTVRGNVRINQRRAHVSWANGVDSEIKISVLSRHDFAKTQQTMFGRNIGRFKGRGH